jgi:hypothetical protein
MHLAWCCRDKKAQKEVSANEERGKAGTTPASRRRSGSEDDEGLLEGDGDNAGESTTGAAGPDRGQSPAQSRSAVSGSSNQPRQIARGRGDEGEGKVTATRAGKGGEHVQEEDDGVDSLFAREASELGTDAARILEVSNVATAVSFSPARRYPN